MYFPSVYRRASTCLASWHFHRRSGSVCQQRFGMTWRGLGIFYQHLLHCPLSRLGCYCDIGYSGNVTNILCTGMVVLSLYTCMLWLSWQTWGFQRINMGLWGRLVGLPVFLLCTLPQLTQVRVLPYLSVFWICRLKYFQFDLMAGDGFGQWRNSALLARRQNCSFERDKLSGFFTT